MKINNSTVSRTYRVQGGASRLYVTADRKIWYGAPDADNCSHVGTLPKGVATTKENVCREANCH